MTRPACILTIAGSDSGGGAGIQADLKTIAMLGGYGASVVTALTAQNTLAVAGIEAPSPEFVALQLKTVLDDLPVAAAKTGMLFSREIIRAVLPLLAQKSFPLVVDPVCVAQSGAQLLKDDAVEAMRDLFALADLVTPNLPEAELFTGLRIQTREDVFEAMARLLAMGPKAVLIKGGHMESVAVTDWLGLPSEDPLPLMQQRVETKNVHGTGCTLSAAIAAGLGQGLDLIPAVRRAQEYLNLALRASFDLGQGAGPPNHLAPRLKDLARAPVLEDLAALGRTIAALPGMARLIPEVRMNVALALPHADAIEDVAAFTGRITCTRKGEVLVAGCPEYGASSHMARTLLAVRRMRPDVACCANVRFNEDTLAALKRACLAEAWFNRADEPGQTREQEGGSMEWGVFKALDGHPDPDSVRAICDPGGDGKEPMIRLLARDAQDLADMLRRILACLDAPQ